VSGALHINEFPISLTPAGNLFLLPRLARAEMWSDGEISVTCQIAILIHNLI
jgi:hypothetical protein